MESKMTFPENGMNIISVIEMVKKITKSLLESFKLTCPKTYEGKRGQPKR